MSRIVNTEIFDKDSLIKYHENGNFIEFLFFWKQKKGIVDSGCLSQWYQCNFIQDGFSYSSAEQFMMAEKARIFNDEKTRKQIVSAQSPREIKELGRKVQGYDDSVWNLHRFNVVVAANEGKFSQNLELRDYLIATESKILVEASPIDIIWGIGLSQEDPRSLDPRLWPGLNYLGFALMKVRNLLIEL